MRSYSVLLVFGTLASVAFSGEVPSAITVTPNAESPTGGIQEAIDSLGPAGVVSNLCQANGRNGISLWDGQSNMVRNNTCVNNSQSMPGRFSGISLSKTENSVVIGNRCFDDQLVKTQKHGIEELANCRGNVLSENDCRGNAQSDLALSGKDRRNGGNQE